VLHNLSRKSDHELARPQRLDATDSKLTNGTVHAAPMRTWLDDCKVSAMRRELPELWTWDALTRVQMKTKGVHGKTWFLDFWGGPQHGGVRAFLKTRGFWAPLSSGVIAKGTNTQAARVNSKFNCTYHPNQNEKGVASFGADPRRVLDEMITYYIDRMLGLDTVPQGRLLSIDTNMYADWFPEWLCAEPKALKRHLNGIKGHGSDRNVVIGWLQQSVEPMANTAPMVSLDCGMGEPNTSIDYGGGPQFLESYYGMALTMALSGRGDHRGNCWATVADGPGSSEWCDRHEPSIDERKTARAAGNQAQNLLAMNLDNDRLYPIQWNTTWPTWPCNFPLSLRTRVIEVSGNFSAATLDSIHKREKHMLTVSQAYHFVSAEDMDYIREKTDQADLLVKRLAGLFRACPQLTPPRSAPTTATVTAVALDRA
jgi:hypothetical protein